MPPENVNQIREEGIVDKKIKFFNLVLILGLIMGIVLFFQSSQLLILLVKMGTSVTWGYLIFIEIIIVAVSFYSARYYFRKQRFNLSYFFLFLLILPSIIYLVFVPNSRGILFPSGFIFLIYLAVIKFKTNFSYDSKIKEPIQNINVIEQKNVELVDKKVKKFEALTQLFRSFGLFSYIFYFLFGFFGLAAQSSGDTPFWVGLTIFFSLTEIFWVIISFKFSRFYFGKQRFILAYFFLLMLATPTLVAVSAIIYGFFSMIFF